MTHLVEIVIGSISDKEKISCAVKLFDEFGVSYNLTVASAHRTPEMALEIAKTAKERGVSAIIAGAGYAAHLAGCLAAHTAVPVIGVPLSGSALNGIDSLLSTVQMPSGIPVATVGIDGAANAAMLALQIIATKDDTIYDKIIETRKQKEKAIIEANKSL